MFMSIMALQDHGPDRFNAPEPPDKGARLFGGQFMAQSLRAAQETLQADRSVHSFHAYFLRPGDVNMPVELSVTRVRDGRSFSSREIVATQRNKELFRMLASYQTPAQTPDYSGRQMPDVPAPEDVEFTYNDFTLQQTGGVDWHGINRPMDIRYINPPIERVPITESQLMWMRISETLPEDPAIHLAGLAYLSDSTLVDHVMLPHGLRWQDSDFAGASLDHAMWFHRPARADEWLLFVQSVESTGAGRGLSRGQFFDRAGRLIATCMQEGLMRWS
jgi:acyl-CoA thioesterase-2